MAERQFPVSVRWRGGHLARADAPGKESLELAKQPQLPHGVATYWRPEDLMVAAVASCYALTLGAVAERMGAPLLDATITASCRTSRDHADSPRVTSIDLQALLEAVPGGERAVATAAAAAQGQSPVVGMLGLPVRVTVSVAAVTDQLALP
jgi:organic hydroperoxide reductase OsmC/OhrA